MKLLPLFIYSFRKSYQFSLKLQNKAKWKRKIKKLIKSNGKKNLTSNQKKQITNFYKSQNFNNVSCKWHNFYSSCNGLFSEKYVPEDLFYMKLEPKLNRYPFTKTLADKNLLEVLFPMIKQPESLIKNINGFFYSKDGSIISEEDAISICNNKSKMIIKPTLDSQGGKNVVLFKTPEGPVETRNDYTKEMFALYEKDFIVQKAVIQHPKMAALNQSSLNTFRVVSYLNNGFVDILSIVVRMGKNGSITDNASGGGLCCGIKEDGFLKDSGYQPFTGKESTMTDSGMPFKEINLPFVDQVKRTIKKNHINVPYFKMISWDIAIDEEGDVVLIEYNVDGQDINLHQLNNGPVLSSILSS
ncbi:sugar-transfer associated ATP-grasp domain-containing protein [Flagellimonas sp.]|uniref:sugar-transfer associated ATP-grasp domain-containing protein n=1 Tax=Flagellimonas sp. TaxID=2058762 RepID=UPI003BAC9FD9